ncbi:hypothetical protein LTR84_012444 [Exophiala bonariae]|uniref:Uncharacterized protein n=1 Tax=Exophiala bonariae TaxID=1690606 RepID=A0AAV9MR43_9EURO|nr:hypothetical protein LTR84_012444 [Exophiala bonariae]
MSQPPHKFLDLSKWSFDALTQQLPATFPADWGHRGDPFDPSNQPRLPLVLDWDGRQLLVQVTDDSWMIPLKASCDPVWRTELEHGQKWLRLDKMVLLIYQLLDKAQLGSKEALYGVWRDMKAVLLLWAINYRIQNMMEAYYMLFPVACIGELVTINKGVQGYLCKWRPQPRIIWSCEISQAGSMRVVEIPWQELIDIPTCVRFTGEMGSLLGELFKLTGPDLKPGK